jgi:hypothetical protein
VHEELVIHTCQILLGLYVHMALNYGAVLANPISQSYRDVSRKY